MRTEVYYHKIAKVWAAVATFTAIVAAMLINSGWWLVLVGVQMSAIFHALAALRAKSTLRNHKRRTLRHMFPDAITNDDRHLFL